MDQTVQCKNPYIYLTFHGYPTKGKGEKESLAAHVHRFKTEAKRSYFTNDAATIRMSVKGLKNAHSLVT